MKQAEIAANARKPYADKIARMEAHNADLVQLLERVAVYLDHPEVTSIPFAVRSEVVAAQVRQAIEALK